MAFSYNTHLHLKVNTNVWSTDRYHLHPSADSTIVLHKDFHLMIQEDDFFLLVLFFQNWRMRTDMECLVVLRSLLLSAGAFYDKQIFVHYSKN